jgi:hypothetical protein
MVPAKEQKPDTAGWDFVWATIAAIVLIFVLLLFAPIHFDHPGRDPKRRCQTNLRMLDGAIASWALDNHKTDLDTPVDSDLFGPTLYMHEKPMCPIGGKYTIGAVNEKVRCSVPGHTL